MTRAAVAKTLHTLQTGNRTFQYFSLPAAEDAGFGAVARLPYSLKVLFENLLRNCHQGRAVTVEEIAAVGHWADNRKAGPDIAYHPARIIMPDSSGIPLLADLAAMRDAMIAFGGDPKAINPRSGVDLVVDHSVIADVSGRPDAAQRNLAIEYERNGERYEFLRWAQKAFRNLRVVPSGNGIIHQVNIEFLAQVVCTDASAAPPLAYPDTVLGMDSHTPMVNALGVVGWGCGGIEAGAAMLGQPVSMGIPEVIGVRFVGALKPGVTATDLVLTITERLRKKGVVQKFVEYCGPGLANVAMPVRATVANMAPEYGATIGFMPIDRQTIAYLHATGREAALVALVEAYAKAQGLWRDDDSPEPEFTDVVEIDLSTIETSIAGPRRPQDRLPLAQGPASLEAALSAKLSPEERSRRVPVRGADFTLGHGDVAVAAITSCTNTSNPQVIIGAALLARNARARGLSAKPWVKTSFSPGSRVVADHLAKSGLQDALDALGFHIVGFGCMTCMGNSGPLRPEIAEAIDGNDLTVAAVLSGNRNFEGRVHTKCRVNYLASPPLVVAYAIAGSMARDLTRDPLGNDASGKPVYLHDIWPEDAEIDAVIRNTLSAEMFKARYSRAFEGNALWQALPVHGGETFSWNPKSDYIRRPPLFEGVTKDPVPIADIRGARALAVLGDSITTDHISPVGVIGRDSAAGRYLLERGVSEKDFNSYGSRRVNHDVMIRGTFANVRLRNEMAGGKEGGYTRHMPDGELTTIFDAAMRYARDGVPLLVIGGMDYGAGSSRDWAAKGTRLLGVRAVIAEGFERIHRSNLVGMGILPLQFIAGQTRKSLRLDGSETYDLESLAQRLAPGGVIPCRVTRANSEVETVSLRCRIDTTYELEYIRNGGILPFMLRRVLAAA